MKQCNKCKNNKSLSEFPWKNKKTGRLHSKCKKCVSADSRLWYSHNKTKHKKNVEQNNQKYRSINRKYVWEYLLVHPCVNCGEKNPIVLEFDHIDPLSKIDCVSNMVHSTCSLKSLKEEIIKCEVRCANCHRIKTAIQCGWWSEFI